MPEVQEIHKKWGKKQNIFLKKIIPFFHTVLRVQCSLAYTAAAAVLYFSYLI